jgi:alpha-glucosidase
MDKSMFEETWWKRGVVYQIYPRSFQDTNDDGIGDLEGVRRRLDYLVWLGVDAIWISPIFASPMADFGYDVSDYCAIHPLFGSLEDFDRLVRDAHDRGLKIILDFVPNHTSDRHPWFEDSRSSRSSPKRDWYIWREGQPGGSPPNNWISNFGGSAWTADKRTGQWYLHSFLPEQPDVNWRNPALKEAMFGALRFWLDRGVDGFRVDVIWLLIKDQGLRDNPPNPHFRPGQAEINRLIQAHNADQPEVHEVIAEMRRILDRYGERVLIGEVYLPLERLIAYYGKDLSGAHLPFNFQMIFAAWKASEICRLVLEYEHALPVGGWPNWVLGNHDQPRIAARVGDAQARIAAMLLLTLRGTPTLYYGDELGIGKVPIPDDAVQDPWEKNEPGLGLGRDPSRTPFQWDRSANAGFTSGTSWLPFSHDASVRNVEILKEDSGSILNLYRNLIQLRRSHLALSIGDFQNLHTEGELLVYERLHGGERLLVALNFGREPHPLPLSGDETHARVLLSTGLDRASGGVVAPTLEANEGVVLAVSLSTKIAP